MPSQSMQGFDTANPPFDRLAHEEAEELRAVLDIGYFSPDEMIVRQGHASDLLHVVIKGAVELRDGNTLLAALGPKDSFDSRAVVHGAAGEDFVAVEETLCYLIPRNTVLDLIHHNAAFAAFFYADVSRKLDAFAQQRKTEGVESVLRARIREAQYRGCVFVDGATTIEQAGLCMKDNNINALFVRDGQRVGVVTGMNLSKAVVLRRLALDTPVREVCHFDVVSVDGGDFIFDALLLMTKHDKRRLAIRSNGDYVGFLEDIDILGLLAGNCDKANQDPFGRSLSHQKILRQHRPGTFQHRWAADRFESFDEGCHRTTAKRSRMVQRARRLVHGTAKKGFLAFWVSVDAPVVAIIKCVLRGTCMRSTSTTGLIVLAMAVPVRAQSTPPAATAPRFIEINPNALLSSRLVGLRLQNADGEMLGTVEDLALEGGQLVGVVLSVAEVSNAGQRFIAVDPSSISIRYTEGEKTWKATLNARFDQLKGAPLFRYEGKCTR